MAQWLSRHAASGLTALPRTGAWLLSKVLTAPGAVAGAASGGFPDGLRRVQAVVADTLPGVRESVEIRLKRAEVAAAKAKRAEQEALAEARNANALADVAKAIGDEGRERLRQATRDGKQEVDRRTQLAREQLARLIEYARDQASREAAETLERITADVRAKAEKARQEAEEAAELAQSRINRAHQRMATALALAAEATAAAERVAEEAHQNARAVADDAEQAAGSADQLVSDAPRTEDSVANEGVHPVRVGQKQDVAAKLTEYTRAELLELAHPLKIPNAARMRKPELIKAILATYPVKAHS
jgi:hypothetical protein